MRVRFVVVAALVLAVVLVFAGYVGAQLVGFRASEVGRTESGSVKGTGIWSVIVVERGDVKIPCVAIMTKNMLTPVDVRAISCAWPDETVAALLGGN